MSRRGRRNILGSAALLVAAAAGYLLSASSLPRHAQLQLPVQEPGSQVPRVRFMGVSTLLFQDGDSAVMTDAFLSRPPTMRVLLGRIAPDRHAVDALLSQAQASKVDAIFVSHSHYDHALDVAEVARRTGALVVGSVSTGNIASAQGPLPGGIREPGDQPITAGRFVVTPFRSLHSEPLRYPGTIGASFHVPARFNASKEGGSYSFLITHPCRRMLVHPSANYLPGMYRNVRAEVVFLGIATLGRREKAFVDAYWREVVRDTGAQWVVPIHWDDFTGSLDDGLKPMPRLMDDVAGGLQAVLDRADRDGVRVGLMPALAPVGLDFAMEGCPALPGSTE